MPKTSPENIKCVCQTLKVSSRILNIINRLRWEPQNFLIFSQLCGYELDIDFPKETEELMNQLSSCENTDVSTQRLLSSVIDLRKIRWGRNNDNNGKYHVWLQSVNKNQFYLFLFFLIILNRMSDIIFRM